MATKTYFFTPEKKVLKQGFYMEDENKQLVYEAKMLKQPLFGPMLFDFVNHCTNKTEMHKVGKTMTIQQGSGILSGFSTKSYFKFDGVKIWDHLHDQGVRIDSALSTNKIGMTYTVTLKGQPLATIASAAPNGGKGILTSSFFYNVATDEENLDLAFLTTFAVARTEQVFYN